MNTIETPAVIPIPPEPFTVLTEQMQQSVWFDRHTGNAMICLAFEPTEFRAAVSLFAQRESLGILPYSEAAELFLKGFQNFATGVIESAAFGEVTRPIDQLLACCAEVARNRETKPAAVPTERSHETHQALAAA